MANKSDGRPDLLILFRDFLSKIAEKSGFNQESIAPKGGITRQTLSKFLDDKYDTDLKIDIYAGCLEALGIDLIRILEATRKVKEAGKDPVSILESGGQPAKVIDGLDLRLAAHQYVEEAKPDNDSDGLAALKQAIIAKLPWEKLSSTWEVRVVAGSNPVAPTIKKPEKQSKNAGIQKNSARRDGGPNGFKALTKKGTGSKSAAILLQGFRASHLPSPPHAPSSWRRLAKSCERQSVSAPRSSLRCAWRLRAWPWHRWMGC